MNGLTRLTAAVILTASFAVHAAAETLPQAHEYQRALRAYIGSLTDKDFAHGVTAEITEQPPSQDADTLYRNFIYTLLNQPVIGSKRGYPAVNAPPRLFTLAVIESPEGIIVPPVWPETLTSFVEWNYPGNPYYNNRGLKLRALVTAAIKMMMVDDYIDKNPTAGRADHYSNEMIVLGSPFRAFKDQMPPEARNAYAAGLKKYARQIMAWGPKGEEANFDMITPIGLWYAMKGCDDPEFTAEATAHARKMFADPKYFHPAGYYVERGGLDIGYSGIANCFAVGAALTGDWPFAKDAIERVYRLKSHLTLPEPDGRWTGPTHFNTRLSSPADNDQWKWDSDQALRRGARDYAAALVTDEAAHLVSTPSADELKGAARLRAGTFAAQIHQNPVRTGNGSKETPYIYCKDEEITGHKWTWRQWPSWDFPYSVNFGYELYPKGFAAHRAELERTNSPMLKSPYLRDGGFVRDFEKAFFATKQPGYAAILHTGPVGHQSPDEKLPQFTSPLGLGGGQLSAFWTPATGSVILGRRGGNSRKQGFDLIEAWRTWPNHSVSGATRDGKFFTSARILNPTVTSEIKGYQATVKVSGPIPASVISTEKNLSGTIDYAREFKLDEQAIRVATTLQGDGKDPIAELYEVIPIFHRDGAIQKPEVVSTIEFQSGGAWGTATAAYTPNVTAVRVRRFTGAVLIAFDKPRRVKLSPEDWTDKYLSGAICRNVLIDLLENNDQPTVIKDARSVAYTISPLK